MGAARSIEFTISLYKRGRQDAQSTAIDCMHELANEFDFEILNGFCDKAPQPVLSAALHWLKAKKAENDFLMPIPFIGRPQFSEAEFEAIRKERQLNFKKCLERLLSIQAKRESEDEPDQGSET